MFINLAWMYITDWRLDAIIRLNKMTGGEEEIVVKESPTNRLYGVKVYSQAEQKMLTVHPCQHDNGGCQKLCFAVPVSNISDSLKVSKVIQFLGYLLFV